MTGSGDVTHNSISKAFSTDPISVSEPGRMCSALMLQAWKWLIRHGRGVLVRGVAQRLKVSETVSLGEKRFVSILQVDGEQFLVGGCSSSIVLLAKLETKQKTDLGRSFGNVFSQVELGVGGGEPDIMGSTEVDR